MAASDSFSFPSCNFIEKENPRCFSVNFAKFLRTYFDRTSADGYFLCVLVNFEKFFRTNFLWSTSGKLLISYTSSRISTSI